MNAAMDLAEDISAGKIDPAELDAELVTACRELFGQVVGPDDPLFELQRDVTRQTLAAGGLSLDEVAEWLSVLRRRSGAVEPTESPAASDPSDMPAVADLAASEPYSPEIDGPEPDLEAEDET